jgi:anti-anti-sigma factor
MAALNENLQGSVLAWNHAALPPPLGVSFEGGEGMPLRAIVSGEIDYAGAFSMQVRVAVACRRRQARGLIVDLAGAEFMSSSGLHALLSLQREPACKRGGMVLSGPTAEVRRILELTGMDRLVAVTDTVEEAESLLLYTAMGSDVSPSTRTQRNPSPSTRAQRNPSPNPRRGRGVERD